MSVLALIPARSKSKGIPGKNWRTLGGETLVSRAYTCARGVGAEQIVVSADCIPKDARFSTPHGSWEDVFLHRPAELAQDDTPMLAVVQHALEQIPGPDDQIIVLLQPTQPLRTVAHVQRAIARLRETQADSVVSVVELPATHHSAMQCRIETWPHGSVLCAGAIDYGATTFVPTWDYLKEWRGRAWENLPRTRQETEPTYIRDGTVYCFWRKTVVQFRTIYGQDVRPLIIPASETCELDTMADWAALEARL